MIKYVMIVLEFGEKRNISETPLHANGRMTATSFRLKQGIQIMSASLLDVFPQISTEQLIVVGGRAMGNDLFSHKQIAQRIGKKEADSRRIEQELVRGIEEYISNMLLYQQCRENDIYVLDDKRKERQAAMNRNTEGIHDPHPAS